MFPRLFFMHETGFCSDDEKRLANMGVLIDTDEQGEITRAELCGPKICDQNLVNLGGLNGIPVVQIGNTSLSKHGKECLKRLLPSSIVEDLDVT